MSRRGQALVEFAMSVLIALLLIFGVVEFCRIMLVYTTLEDAARMGARYAITHGTIPGTSSPDEFTIESGIVAVVQKFLAPGTVNVSSAHIASYFGGAPGCPISTTAPGCPVRVTVSYPYDLLIHALPISITLSAQSEGVITW
jgi:Flp pilus assembly protein TadG